MSAASLSGRTGVVVGASSGVGRGVARRMIEAGVDVLAAARRGDLLGTLINEAKGGRTLQCDLVDPDAGGKLVAGVRDMSDHLDLLFVSSGSAHLQTLRETTVDEWRSALETNVIGINRLITALFPLLRPESVVVIISSETATLPRSHLGAYGASKAALEHSIMQWREEHPWLRLTTVSLGGTVPTDFARAFSPEVTLEALTAWSASGRNQEAFMATEEVCGLLVDVMATLLTAPSVGLQRLELRSPSSVATDLGFTRSVDLGP